MIVGGLVLVYPSLIQDLIGFGLFGLATLLQVLRRGRQLEASTNSRVVGD